MTKVVNKDKIALKILQSVEEGKSFPTVVSKLVARLNYDVGIGGAYEDEFSDAEYAYDYESAMVLNMHFRDCSSIKPSDVYYNTAKEGATIEWKPRKKIYIYTLSQCIKLYNSFANYLEGTKFAELFGKSKFKICFYPLYEYKGNTNDVSNENDDFQQSTEIQFSKELFHANKMYVHTLEGVFEQGHSGWSDEE